MIHMEKSFPWLARAGPNRGSNLFRSLGAGSRILLLVRYFGQSEAHLVHLRRLHLHLDKPWTPTLFVRPVHVSGVQ